MRLVRASAHTAVHREIIRKEKRWFSRFARWQSRWLDNPTKCPSNGKSIPFRPVLRNLFRSYSIFFRSPVRHDDVDHLISMHTPTSAATNEDAHQRSVINRFSFIFSINHPASLVTPLYDNNSQPPKKHWTKKEKKGEENSRALTWTLWSKLLTMRITRPALGFSTFGWFAVMSASRTDALRPADLLPQPWLPGDAYHMPFFLP